MSQWFYSVDGEQRGPVTADDLRRFLAEKSLQPGDFVWNPGMPAWAEANDVLELGGEPPLFAVTNLKLLLMFFGTCGVYEVYWLYKQWDLLRPRMAEEIRPFWRAVFAIFFFHALVNEVNAAGEEQGIEERLPAVPLSILFVLCSFAGRLPDPYWLVAFVAVIPVLVVQARVNAILAKAVPLADRNGRIRGWNWLAMVAGLPFMVWVVIVAFTGL